MSQDQDAVFLQSLRAWEDDVHGFCEVDLWQIIPGGGWGYALDDQGHVSGIKMSVSEHSNVQGALDLIIRFKHLQRLVFYSLEDVRIPPSVAQLEHLSFVCFGLRVKTLPVELVESQRSIHLEYTITGGTSEWNGLRPIVKRYEAYLSLERNTTENQYSTPAETVYGRKRRVEPRIPLYDLEVKDFASRSLDLTGIFLASTELEDPPVEIVFKGRDAVLNYFRGRLGGDLPLSEVKILLVGNGSAGKTSLVKRVLGKNFDPHESQTHGINILSHIFTADHGTDLKAHFWDFGGQEIMHATHQFFLSKRSIYILVLDGRKEEDAEYWLQHIESFGGESPVLVVLNKIDENPAFEVNRRFLSAKYNGIVGFYRVSCATGVGIGDFRGSILTALSRVSILQTRWPRNWFRVKERLESPSTEYISVKEYSALCDREGITDQESQDNLVDFLHDLGVVLHFRDLQLLDTHVLEPRWVTGAVYRLITSDVLAAQKGVLRLRQIGGLLERPSVDSFKYSKDKHAYIVEIMLKFELCYRLNNDAILVPDLLDVQEPAFEFQYIGSLRFVLRYSYLPKSVIPRLIVRMNTDIKGTNRWRTGVQLEDRLSKAVALVRADQKAKRIEVFVNGERRRDYFSVIRNVLNDINSSFEKLQVTECVPLPDAPGVEVEYSDLIGHEFAGRGEIFIGKLGKAYSVSGLLNGIEEERTRREQPRSVILNVRGDFISQSVTAPSETVKNQRIVLESPKMVKRSYEPQTWERILTFGAGILFFALIAFLAIRNQPISDPNIVVLLRILMSLMTAVFGATVPGMLRVDFSKRGLVIRATGALALFVLTYVMTPSVLHPTPR